jgi:hypothetical protein
VTPESIRKIQNGEVFSYDEPAADKALSEVVAEMLAEEPPTSKKVKATRLARPELAETAESPQTNVPLTQRPHVDFNELVEWLVVHPGATHAEIGAAYGRPAGWFSTIVVTSEFQDAMGPRRAEIDNPGVTTTLEERFQALVVRSVDILQSKLSVANPDPLLTLEAAKLGVRALGLGNAGRDTKPVEGGQSLETLADRLTALVVNRRGGSIGAVPAATEFVEDVTPKAKEV